MLSLPAKPSSAKPAPALSPYAIERIESEIEHLRKREAARYSPNRGQTRRMAWMTILLVGGLLGLFFMDPALHALRRAQAIRDYLYLHSYGSEKRATELLATQIFTPNEIIVLNRRRDPVQDYYASPVQANRDEEAIVSYLRGVDNLHRGKYDDLNVINKIRYQFFIRLGMNPPVDWKVLDPSIDH